MVVYDDMVGKVEMVVVTTYHGLAIAGGGWVDGWEDGGWVVHGEHYHTRMHIVFVYLQQFNERTTAAVT